MTSLIKHHGLKTVVKQNLPSASDLNGYLRGEGGMLAKCKEERGVQGSVNPFKRWVSWFALNGWGTRRPAFVSTESKWTIQIYEKSWFLWRRRTYQVHYVRYTFRNTSTVHRNWMGGNKNVQILVANFVSRFSSLCKLLAFNDTAVIGDYNTYF